MGNCMALTFADFFAQAMAQPILFVILVLIIGVTAVSGATDAPNAIATVVSTRCLKPNTAIGMAAVFNFVGLVGMTFVSTAVAKTMFGMVDFSGNTDAALLALVAAMNGWAGVVPSEWVKVIYGMVFSLLAGFALGWVFTKIIERVFEMANRQAANIAFTAIQDLCAVALSFLHGAQDGQKFMSIAMLGIALSFGSSTPDAGGFPMWVMITCSLAISAGTVVGGKRIIKSVGMDMVKLEKYQGVAANFSTVFTLLFASLTGMPVSTGHCNTSAIMGVGASRSIKRVNWGIAKNMLLAWVITVPACGLIGFVLAKLFMMLA